MPGKLSLPSLWTRHRDGATGCGCTGAVTGTVLVSKRGFGSQRAWEACYDVDYSLRFSLVAHRVLWLVPVSRGGWAWLAKGGPVNNLQLFRMYDRFITANAHALSGRARFGPDFYRGDEAINGILMHADRYARDYQKWWRLAESARVELEKRLTPPADDSLQRRNDAVRFCARLGLFTPDGRIEYRR